MQWVFSLRNCSKTSCALALACIYMNIYWLMHGFPLACSVSACFYMHKPKFSSHGNMYIYICMCIYIYTPTHTHTHIYIYTYIHLYIVKLNICKQDLAFYQWCSLQSALLSFDITKKRVPSGRNTQTWMCWENMPNNSPSTWTWICLETDLCLSKTCGCPDVSTHAHISILIHT